jgi:hypothetical protein
MLQIQVSKLTPRKYFGGEHTVTFAFLYRRPIGRIKRSSDLQLAFVTDFPKEGSKVHLTGLRVKSVEITLAFEKP